MTQNCNCHGSGGDFSQTVAAVLERPRYSPGLILEDSDLTAAVDYARDLNRLLFRNLFGCGVICGLIVEAKEKCGLMITVGTGLALDGCGDPIQLPKPVTITIDDNVLRDWQNDVSQHRLWVILCGKEKNCRPRSLVCDADEFDGVAQPTRIRSLSEVSLIRTAGNKLPCVCGCQPQRSDDEANPNARRGASNEDPCQAEHEGRDECAEDCGCGTACACGCCVLLAEIKYAGEQWKVAHAGVRRLVRPKLIPDHEPKEVAVPAGPAVAYDERSRRALTKNDLVARFEKFMEGRSKLPETITAADLAAALTKKKSSGGGTQ